VIQLLLLLLVLLLLLLLVELLGVGNGVGYRVVKDAAVRHGRHRLLQGDNLPHQHLDSIAKRTYSFPKIQGNSYRPSTSKRGRVDEAQSTAGRAEMGQA
jgi:hypothetical protein